MVLTPQQLQEGDGHLKADGISLNHSQMNEGDSIVNRTTYKQPTGGMQYLPDALGTIGAIAGEAIGTPADVVSGPGGTMVGGGIGGGIGQGLGQVIENLITGNPIQSGVGQQFASGGAMGAIPGVSESKLATKLGIHALENTAGKKLLHGGLRFGANALTGGISQEMQNLNPTAQHGNVALSSLLNGIAGVGGPKLAEAIGKSVGGLALGKGGFSLPELNKFIPGGVAGGAKKILSKVGLHDDYSIGSAHFIPKDPIENELLGILKSSKATMSRKEFEQVVDNVIGNATGPFSAAKGAELKTQIMKDMESHLKMYEEHTGKDFSGKALHNQPPTASVEVPTAEPSAGLNLTPNKMVRTSDVVYDAKGKPIQKTGTGKFVQTGHTGAAGNEPLIATQFKTPVAPFYAPGVAERRNEIGIPLDFWHSFKQRISNDGRWTGDVTKATDKKVAENTSGALAHNIKQRSGKPELVDRYNKLILAQKNIAQKMKASISGNNSGKENAKNALSKFGATGLSGGATGLGLLGFLSPFLHSFIHHPLATSALGATTAVLAQPRVGSNVAKFAPYGIQQLAPRAMNAISEQKSNIPSAMMQPDQ